MKKSGIYIVGLAMITIISCNSNKENKDTAPAADKAGTQVESQAGTNPDNTSSPNVVQIAVGSKDHTTLVTAVTTAELADDLSTTGPFTVFAPTNAAFEKLPAGTVEGLLKKEKKEALIDILQYHVYVGVIKTDYMQDGQVLNQVNGGNITISKKENAFYINGNSKIVASIPASNGIIHVIDGVLLPPAQK